MSKSAPTTRATCIQLTLAEERERLPKESALGLEPARQQYTFRTKHPSDEPHFVHFEFLLTLFLWRRRAVSRMLRLRVQFFQTEEYRMRRLNLLTRPLSLLGLIAAFAAQTGLASAHTGGNVSGIVRDATSGEPLAGVSLLITSGSQSETATTNAQGHFTVFTLQPGEYSVTADKPGYGAQAVLGYIVDAEETGLCDFRLGAAT
jgi:hypothetical protein